MNTQHLGRIVLTAAMVLGLAAAVGAESFDYLVGPLLGQGGWADTDDVMLGPTQPTTDVVEGSLAFGTITTSGNRLYVENRAVSRTNRGMPLDVNWDEDGHFYLGYMTMKALDEAGGGDYWIISLGKAGETVDDGYGVHGIGSSDQYNGFGNTLPPYAPDKATVFVLMDVTTVATGDDSIGLSFFETPGASGGITDATPVWSGTLDEERTGTTEYFMFKIGGAPLTEAWIDEIRWGSTIEDVAPTSGTPPPIPGDANRDRVVNDADASILAAHWQQAGNWSDGDFNNDGYVNDQDASILAAHWLESQEGTAPVPEPGSVILLIGAVLSLLVWRLRCR